MFQGYMEGTQASTGIIKICMGLESVAGMAVKSHRSSHLQPTFNIITAESITKEATICEWIMYCMTKGDYKNSVLYTD